MIRLLIGCMVVTAGIISCSRAARSSEQLLEYIQDPSHGLLQKKEINGTTIKLTYKPSILLANQEIQAYDTLESEGKNEIIQRYNKQLYFVLSFSHDNREILSTYNNQQWFGEMVNQFAFGMGEKINMVTAGGDTLQLLDFHYPRMYGMAPSTDILLVFEKPDLKKTKELKLKMHDIGLKTGDIKFIIKTKDIRKTPGLIIKN